MRLVTVAIAATTGCAAVADHDGIFYNGDRRSVHCAVNLDSSARHDIATIYPALDRAAARGETVELYAHKPGVTVPLDKLEQVLAGASERGLAFVTYRDFAAGGGTGPGIALSFDDNSVETWMDARELLIRYRARVTFFVSRFAALDDQRRIDLHTLADDGHDIAAHSANHLRAPTYVEQHGIAGYLADEALPSISALEAEGYRVTSYAYPFGARTGELDRALLDYVPILRAVEFTATGLADPCPE